MSLIACRECQKEVSDVATKCPHCGARLRKPKRGFFGKIFKWTFILFNILMVIWLFSYWGEIGNQYDAGANDAQKVGTAIGGTIATGMLASIWMFGDIILGLFVLFTRPRD